MPCLSADHIAIMDAVIALLHFTHQVDYIQYQVDYIQYHHGGKDSAETAIDFYIMDWCKALHRSIKQNNKT